MMSEKKVSIAGISLKGGRKDNFYLCLIHYFPEQSRAFVAKLLQVGDEFGIDGNEAIKKWVKEYDLSALIVDFPLTKPPCLKCELDCPGIQNCSHDEVNTVNEMIKDLLKVDEIEHNKFPKDYEYSRLKNEEFVFRPECWRKGTDEPILSRSFKRRLKKGFLPYWNRPVDFWIWCRYHDQLLEVFKNSFDSFGQTPLILLNRFEYLKRHLPKELTLLESSTYLIMLEMVKSNLLLGQDLKNLSHLEESIGAKEKILSVIESELGLFVYGPDQSLILKNQRAFDSLLLAIAGLYKINNKCYDLPDFVKSKELFALPELS